MTHPSITRLPLDLQERLVVSPEGHWIWLGAIGNHGYGTVWYTLNGVRRKWLVHRLIYTLLFGPIENGLFTDHLCRERRCANAPEHLELVTPGENVRRGKGARLKTYCANGHLWIPENKRRNGGFTLEGLPKYCCRICYRERVRRRALRKRSQFAP